MESDDDFDETTLWEIASLLKSENVPSKNSLLPPPREREMIEDYDEETEFEEDEEAEEVYQKSKAAQRPVTKLPIMPLSISVKEDPKAASVLRATGLTSALEAVKTGLPQPEPSAWQAYIPSSDSAVRSKPRPSAWLPALSSRDLCAVSESEATSLSVSPMWSGNTTPKAVLSMTSAPKAKSNFMWAPKPKQAEVHTVGLFSLDAQRSEFRTTQASPAACSMVRTPRSSNASLSTLSSQSLWVSKESTKKATIVWTSSAVSQKTPAQIMWTPVTTAASVTIVGLFSLSHSRADYRTSDQLPATLNVIRKPRTVQSPLAQLTSTSLWPGLSELPYEHHWISESSIRPTSPSVYSESSSGRSSPASETSSISGASLKSTSTKASSLWGSIKSASTLAWWDSKGSRKSPSLPPTGENAGNAKFVSKLPVVKGKGLEPVKESQVLASRDMWEVKTAVSLGETPKRNFRQVAAVVKKEEKVAHQPLRQKFRPTVAFKANWNEALAEAIAAGTPKMTLSRPVATEADWEAALAEAVANGKVRVQRLKATPEMWTAALEEAIVKSTIPRVTAAPRCDPAVRHPVFFTESMISTASEVHPATIGYVNIAVPQFDPAVLHPVFFTSSLVSPTTDIHPAATGHVMRPQAKPMWTAPLSHVSALEAPVGSMWLKGKVAAAQFEHDKTETKRKAPVSRSAKLPLLESTNIWQPIQIVPVLERNWIAAAKLNRAQTWTAPAVLKVEESQDMWTPKSALKVVSLDKFAHLKCEHIKKSSPRPAALPRLNSNKLFTPASAISNEAIHWLHTTSTSLARTTPSAGMWMAPKKGASSKKSEADMFSHATGKYVKKVTSSRPAAPARLNSNELFTSVSRTENETHWLHSTSPSSTSTPRSSSPITSTPAQQPLPVTISQSQTWAAKSLPLASIEGNKVSMWTSHATLVVKSPTLFSNPHTEPWTRKKRSDSGVELDVGELQSREMWNRKWVMPESPKEWLRKSEKRVCKVQFRY